MSDTEEKRYITRYNALMEEFNTFQEQQRHFHQELLQEIRSQRAYILFGRKRLFTASVYA